MGCGSSKEAPKFKNDDYYNSSYNQGYDYSKPTTKPEEHHPDWREGNLHYDDNDWKDKNYPNYPAESSNKHSDDTEDETPFDDDDDGVTDRGTYQKNETGLLTKVLDARSKFLDEKPEKRPQITPGKLYVDDSFPLKTAIKDNKNISWKRPKDFLENPKLFTEGTTRFDIGQGTAGTCWFLAVLAEIADRKDLIKRIIPEDAYFIDNPNKYDGVFHARFFDFGKCKDFYTDDCLPVINGDQLWGAHSSTDCNELWVALCEKAFAKMHGSYDAIYGGQPGEAYYMLTGGICERIELDVYDDDQKELVLFNRTKNALASGCHLSCIVPDECDKYKGLVGGHAYSLTGVFEHPKTNTRLIKIRNPWGAGEWKGDWSDGSPQWSAISNSSASLPKKDDGEFYVSLSDFMKYFSHTVICSQTPDSDCDGRPDALNHVLNIYGEWYGKTAAGFHNRLQNQRFAFTVTDKGLVDNSYMPLVVQVIQQCKNRKADKISIRCDVFKVLANKIQPKGRQMALDNLGKNTNVYTPELQTTYRFKLRPGRYVIIASTAEKGQEKAFLLRLFTPCPLENVKEIPQKANVVACESENSVDVRGRTYNLTFQKVLFGEFIIGRNAGGQVRNRASYHTNPQYLISIRDTETPLVIQVMQALSEPLYPIGVRIFQLERDTKPPVGIKYLYEHYDSCPSHMEGSQTKFVEAENVTVRYFLPPGRYLAVVFLDKPNTEKPFCIVFRASTHVAVKGFQTG
ncbi:unnamed protein product [Candidula unifasciata]|uniref:Calpain catalytic domain-containing protein n=1 Tax=Candidula unifasciata TaxID=100452 RepID=A0A8S4A071_9EUPU|nr:unnamed protein product [Candidula unifasciata]